MGNDFWREVNCGVVTRAGVLENAFGMTNQVMNFNLKALPRLLSHAEEAQRAVFS